MADLAGQQLDDPSVDPLSRPLALVLPVGVLVLGMQADLSQITRAGMIQAMESAYVRMRFSRACRTG